MKATYVFYSFKECAFVEDTFANLLLGRRRVKEKKQSARAVYKIVVSHLSGTVDVQRRFC